MPSEQVVKHTELSDGANETERYNTVEQKLITVSGCPSENGIATDSSGEEKQVAQKGREANPNPQRQPKPEDNTSHRRTEPDSTDRQSSKPKPTEAAQT